MHVQAMDIPENKRVTHYYGRVGRRLDDIFEVETPLGLIRARQAAGCLLTPEIGDKVLTAAEGLSDGYILNILERPADREAVLEFAHGVRVTAPRGSVRLAAGHEVSIDTHNLAFNAVRGEATVLDFRWTGRTFSAGLEKAKIVLDTLETSLDVSVQNIRRSYRYIAELEQACLGRLRYLVDGALFMKGRRSSVVADEKVKIDADSIELG